MGYLRKWFSEFWRSFQMEFRSIFSDGGVLLIFIVAGLLYPVLFNLIYRNGIVEDTPIAVVDLADCAASRRYVREIDATRELSVAYKCATMEEAQRLMQKRKVNGIVYFPGDFGDKLAAMETATLSLYADMGTFLYYKNLLMGVSFVRLSEMRDIQIERAEMAGQTHREAQLSAQPLLYEENNPYNNAFSYSIFFLSAVLLVIIQQTMCYGMSLLAGTRREEKRSFALEVTTLHPRGVGRSILGRGAAYALVYMAVSMYIAILVPAIFGLPQRGDFGDVLLLLGFFIADCVFFSMFWSTFVTRRETVFLLYLCFSPIALFLTGFSWPVTSFPRVWQLFSYIFPTTFAVPAFIDINTAGADLLVVRDLFRHMVVQTIAYCALSFVAVYVENIVLRRRAGGLSGIPGESREG